MVPLGIDRYVHCRLALRTCRRKIQLQQHGMKHWKPHMDDQGLLSMFHEAVTESMAGWTIRNFNDFVSMLVSAGRVSGTCVRKRQCSYWDMLSHFFSVRNTRQQQTPAALSHSPLFAASMGNQVLFFFLVLGPLLQGSGNVGVATLQKLGCILDTVRVVIFFGYKVSTVYRLLLRRRLRRPLPMTSRCGRCRRALDLCGDHRAACAQGVYAAKKICREAARVTTNTRIIDLSIHHADTQDDRRIEVIANGPPLWGGAQLALDAPTHAGKAKQRHSLKGREVEQGMHLLRDRRCRLVVFGIEVRGRGSDETTTFFRLPAHSNARQALDLPRHSLTNALIHRWSAMLPHAAMHAFAAAPP